MLGDVLAVFETIYKILGPVVGEMVAAAIAGNDPLSGARARARRGDHPRGAQVRARAARREGRAVARGEERRARDAPALHRRALRARAAPPRDPGVGVTLWTGGDLAAALPCAHAQPAGGVPPADRLPARRAVAPRRRRRRARARRRAPSCPAVRIHEGIGCDVWLAQAIRGEVTEAKAIDALAGAAEHAADLGAEAAIYDAEASAQAQQRGSRSGSCAP
jgi:hypothetical protein